MSSTSRSSLREAGFIGQLVAGAGAVLILLGSFGIGFVGAGVGCLILGVVVSAPYARNPGPFLAEWWNLLAVAAFVCLTGFAFSFVALALGGILAAVGAVAALIAVALGAPPES